MNAGTRLQQAIDRYVHDRTDEDGRQVFVLLVRYLAHDSDLAPEQEWDEESEFSDWEAELEEQMVRLLEGDTEPEHDLGSTPLDALAPEHVRDFLAWFLPRESATSDWIRRCGEELRHWFAWLHREGEWDGARRALFDRTVRETVEEAARASMLARILYYYVRSGCAMAPHVRGKRFTAFAEGHARVGSLDTDGMMLYFDGRDAPIGPVALPKAVLSYVREGDVLDVELGKREGRWYIVDSGPVYPSCVHVDAAEVQGLDKIA